LTCSENKTNAFLIDECQANQKASISWDKRKESVQLGDRRGPLLLYSLPTTDTRYSLLPLASLFGYLRLPVKEKDIFFLNKILLALNLWEKKRGVQTCMDTMAFFTGPRNVALFMHIIFKLERVGKLFLSQFQSLTSQAFSTSLFATS